MRKIRMATYRITYRSGATRDITVDLATLQGIYTYYRLSVHGDIPFTMSLISTDVVNPWNSDVPCEAAYHSICMDPAIFKMHVPGAFPNIGCTRLQHIGSLQLPSGKRGIYIDETYSIGVINVVTSDESALREGILLMDTLCGKCHTFILCDFTTNNECYNRESFSRLDGFQWNELPPEIQEIIASTSPSMWMCVSRSYCDILFPLLTKDIIQDDRKGLMIGPNYSLSSLPIRIDRKFARLISMLCHVRRPTIVQKAYILSRLQLLDRSCAQVLCIEPIIRNMFDPEIIESHIRATLRIFGDMTLLYSTAHTNFQYLKRLRKSLQVGILSTINTKSILLDRDRALSILTSLEYLRSNYGSNVDNDVVMKILPYLEDEEVEYALRNLVTGFGKSYVLINTQTTSVYPETVRISRIMLSCYDDFHPDDLKVRLRGALRPLYKITKKIVILLFVLFAIHR